MTDFITRYNERVEAAHAVKEKALDIALDVYNAACVEAFVAWRAASLVASVELREEMAARAKAYVEGTPAPGEAETFVQLGDAAAQALARETVMEFGAPVLKESVRIAESKSYHANGYAPLLNAGVKIDGYAPPLVVPTGTELSQLDT